MENMKRRPSASISEYLLQEWRFEDFDDAELREFCQTIRTWAKPGKWLDLGCGPLLSVWPMFVIGDTEIFGCDRHPDISAFHFNLLPLDKINLPYALRVAVDYYNVAYNGRRAYPPLDRIVEIATGSVTERRDRWIAAFDTVVQIGCFGCLDSLAAVQHTLTLVESYLRPGGIFISGTWVPRDDHLESFDWGGDKLRNMSSEQFSNMVTSAGLRILSEKRTPMTIHYQERFIQVAEKPL